MATGETAKHSFGLEDRRVAQREHVSHEWQVCDIYEDVLHVVDCALNDPIYHYTNNDLSIYSHEFQDKRGRAHWVEAWAGERSAGKRATSEAQAARGLAGAHDGVSGENGGCF